MQIAGISARIEEVREEVENATEEVSIPKNLSSQIRKRLKTDPTQSWDEVLLLGHFIYAALANDARCRDSGRVPLKTEHLRNVIGQRYLDAVRQAVAQQ